MSDRFNDTFNNYYRARLEIRDVHFEHVVGSQTPVKLSLALSSGASLKPALATPPQEAILALDMTAETAAHLFGEVRKIFRERGWTLP